MALSATAQWDVRTTGNDANGGAFDPGVTSPGTDFSQQNSAQVAYTDLVIGGTTTQLTSAGNPFTSAHVGNIINITGGTGFTVARYEVLSVSGGTATMDRAVGTAASTGGTGNLGGSMATVGAAVTAAAASNTVHIKSGTYTVTASITFAVSTLSLIGYNATHNDGGTKPLITTATNSTVIFNTGSSNSGVQIFSNLSLSNTAATRASGIWQLNGAGSAQTWVFVGCLLDGFNTAIDNSDGTPYYVAWIHVINTEIRNSSLAINVGSGSVRQVKIFGSYFHGNGQLLDSSGSGVGSIWLEYSIFAGSTSSFGMNVSDPWIVIDHCTFANNVNSAQTVGLASASGFTSITNTIFYGNTAGTGLGSVANAANIAAAAAGRSNAFGNNGTNYAGWNGSSGDVILTAVPFTNAGAGDYSPNSTAGGGAALKGAAFPGVFPGGTSTGHADIGAVQSSGGGGGAAGMLVTTGMQGGIRG